MDVVPNVRRDNLRTILEFLITPQDEEEEKIRAEFSDDYQKLKAEIPTMSEEQLTDAINHHLKHFGLSVENINLT